MGTNQFGPLFAEMEVDLLGVYDEYVNSVLISNVLTIVIR